MHTQNKKGRKAEGRDFQAFQTVSSSSSASFFIFLCIIRQTIHILLTPPLMPLGQFVILGQNTQIMHPTRLLIEDLLTILIRAAKPGIAFDLIPKRKGGRHVR